MLLLLLLLHYLRRQLHGHGVGGMHGARRIRERRIHGRALLVHFAGGVQGEVVLVRRRVRGLRFEGVAGWRQG